MKPPRAASRNPGLLPLHAWNANARAGRAQREEEEGISWRGNYNGLPLCNRMIRDKVLPHARVPMYIVGHKYAFCARCTVWSRERARASSSGPERAESAAVRSLRARAKHRIYQRHARGVHDATRINIRAYLARVAGLACIYTIRYSELIYLRFAYSTFS